MKRVARFIALSAVLCLVAIPAMSQQEEASVTAQAAGVNAIRFSGVLRDGRGRPVAGATSVTFTLYADQEGTQPLWSETQQVRVDGQGRYTVLLGSENPLPLDAFSADSARWLGARQASGRETRTLLVSVPYALKSAFSAHAASADSLGGVPASNFVTRGELSTSSSGMMVL